MPKTKKLSWEGRVISVQPRIRLTRSFDERYHNYLGFILRIYGKIENETKEFTIGIGKATQAKKEFQAGDIITGECLPPSNPEAEPADYYKASKLKNLEKSSGVNPPPPWHGIPPTLEEYRARGHRRLAKRTYKSKCSSCIWGAWMAVEMIIDHWNPGKVKYRTETFCYGPKSCDYYKAGPNRKVPGRKGMVYEEPDWIDEDETSHR